MTPIEAWHIISANLAEFYKMRRTNTFKGWTEADTEAEVIAFQALQRMNAANAIDEVIREIRG